MLTLETRAKVPTSQMIKALQEAAHATEGFPLTQTAYRLFSRGKGWPSVKLLYTRFGNWGAALEAAGIPHA